MNKIWNGNWQGRHSEAWSGTIDELRQLIPNFSIWKEDNGYLGSNKYLDLIVRDPSDSGEGNHGNLIDSVKKAPPILIAAVSNGFGRERYRGRQQGYKLVQHHEMLDSILGTLRNKHTCVSENPWFRILQPLKNPESLEATLRISEYGARMWIEFPVPNYEFYLNDGEPYVLKITCLNSVDRKFALRIGLSLYREFSNEIFMAGFHRNHDQELEDNAIEAFLNYEFIRFINGKWIRQTVPAGQIEDLIPDYLNKTDSEKIISLYTQLTKALSKVEGRLLQESGEMNYLLFRTALSALVHEQKTLHSQAQKMAKVLDLLEKIEEENSSL